jgi:hypothetical protein
LKNEQEIMYGTVYLVLKKLRYIPMKSLALQSLFSMLQYFLCEIAAGEYGARQQVS